MAAKEIVPLYDLMLQLFVACMPQTKISVQLLGYIMNIPVGTMAKVVSGCPLPNGTKITRGGHRGLEIFITQPNFISRVDRAVAVNVITKKPEWHQYGVVLPVLVDDIIAQVEKVIENTVKLRGSNVKKSAIINNGCPEVYRLSWFIKDPIQGEFYNTIQEAIHKSKGGNHKGILPIIPTFVDTNAERPLEKKIHLDDKYGLPQFVCEIQDLIRDKEMYKQTIKKLENKINCEYPALISLKEAEKAVAEKQVIELKDRIKVLEIITTQQTEEIKNLKRHPKFAGMVKVSELRK